MLRKYMTVISAIALFIVFCGGIFYILVKNRMINTAYCEVNEEQTHEEAAGTQIVSSHMINNGFLADDSDLDSISENCYYLLASSRQYQNAPFSEGLLITTLNGVNSDFCTVQRMYELTTGAEAYRYLSQNEWSDWIIKHQNDGNLKIAMFGDSIIWGSISGKQTDKGIPYFVQLLTGYTTDNYGVGSQGWTAVAGGRKRFRAYSQYIHQ